MSYKTWAIAHPELTYGYYLIAKKRQELLERIEDCKNLITRFESGEEIDTRFSVTRVNFGLMDVLNPPITSSEKAAREKERENRRWIQKQESLRFEIKLQADHIAQYNLEIAGINAELQKYNVKQSCIFGKPASFLKLERAVLERFYPLINLGDFKYIEGNTYDTLNLEDFHHKVQSSYFFSTNAYDYLQKLIRSRYDERKLSMTLRGEFLLNETELLSWICVLKDGHVSFTRRYLGMCPAISRSILCYVDYYWDELIAAINQQSSVNRVIV